tara:strand:+ start:43 stop:258 length:216 start_codon:yes stop_codon:yes gene_type:complete
MKTFEWIESVPMLTMKGLMIAEKVKITGDFNLKTTRLDLASRGIITTDETVWIDSDGSEFFWPGSKNSLDK